MAYHTHLMPLEAGGSASESPRKSLPFVRAVTQAALGPPPFKMTHLSAYLQEACTLRQRVVCLLECLSVPMLLVSVLRALFHLPEEAED